MSNQFITALILGPLLYIMLALMFVNLVVIWVWNAKCGIICLCILPIMTINGGNSHNFKEMFGYEILRCISRHARLVHLFLLTCVYFQPQRAHVCPQTLTRKGGVA